MTTTGGMASEADREEGAQKGRENILDWKGEQMKQIHDMSDQELLESYLIDFTGAKTTPVWDRMISNYYLSEKREDGYCISYGFFGYGCSVQRLESLFAGGGCIDEEFSIESVCLNPGTKISLPHRDYKRNEREVFEIISHVDPESMIPLGLIYSVSRRTGVPVCNMRQVETGERLVMLPNCFQLE